MTDGDGEHADGGEGLELVLEHLKAIRAFDFTGYKRATLGRRIGKRMQHVGAATHEEYLDYLEVHPDEFEPLFNTILINVTSFFRDEEVWESLRSAVVPELAAVHRELGRPIRIWSAGCASGQEAYSAVMLLARRARHRRSQGPDQGVRHRRRPRGARLRPAGGVQRTRSRERAGGVCRAVLRTERA